jgi:transposase-like protein
MSTFRDPLYRRHRFPPEVISYAVWLYFRFPLSLCEFRRNPAGDSDLMSAAVPI